MEEASVAGESPDRSKQRESSAERTSGSVGPVPGARSEAGSDETRDPRLAVSRSAERGSTGGGGADTATRVRADRAGGPEADAGAGGDGPLREAVAAWVRTADDEDAGSGAGVDTHAGSGAGADATEDAEDADKPAESPESPQKAAGGAQEALKGSDGAQGGEAGSGGAEGAQKPVARPAASDAPDAPDEPAPAAASAASGAPDAPDASEGTAASEGTGASEARETRAVPEAAGTAEVPEETAELPDASEAASAPASPEAPTAPTAPKNSETSEPPAAKGAPRAGTPDADPDPDDDNPADGTQPAAPDAPDTDEADAPTEPPVDQPTAVFKAPAAASAVDQPTTMLKLGGAEKSEKDEKGEKDDKGTGGPKDAEAPAERTSKFVALKPLDDPAVRKPVQPVAGVPAPAAEGTPAPAAEGFERTRQQPLPPKPPLDLLAELTNTPPPPETPLRTAWRRVKIWTPLVLLLVIVVAVVQAVRPLPTPTLKLTAQETVSFEGGKPSVPWPTQGQAAMDVNGIGSFGTSGDQKPVPIASIAKVMTVYLVLRDHPLKTGEKGPQIPVDAAAQKHYETGKAENESVVKVTEGQKITEYEALQAVMLPSANNIAKLLARWDTGSASEDAFVEKMNKTAKELGMENTTYTDPSGLDKTTVSTAADLVKLGRAAMENPVFKEISRQPSYVDLNGDQQNNFFGLVPTVAIGIKTGTTTAAGGNILFAAEKEVGGKTQTIIGAALGQYGQNGTANIDEVTGIVRKLIEAGQDALTAKTIVQKGEVVGEVDDGLGGTTPVVATKDVSAVGWSGLTVRLELDDLADGSVPHTAAAGTKVGTLTVGDGTSAETVEVPVALKEDLAEPPLTSKLTRIA
ncbi:D-alanyl-D-alanine carboxypeptidase [Streptomyces griseoviridis]|uniref:D-alanyl-D-alanine carboxypeptidase n=1 Tax=Streptomyces griseoviridis TaxID=45398 RepID=UPI003F88161C